MPVLRIERPEVGDKIFFHERPALARFGTTNLARFDPATQFFFAKLKKIGGLLKIQGANRSG
ncbi:hypothetical protein OW716_00400 [Acidithiobacillus ferriphilus]|uniref:Uncharacterized protein n=2 Tax=Acidithiobacillus TaxID=119977 RepID=A0A179BDM6_ACIFR|nr:MULTISPECIES: hypothetical protein [Acidithiobacillus]MEB8486698.1 hypothetical protein [Acidithiobacillus ferriphilus]MEB8489048.1 hypothetical protein [Acidithiobacillus ferriphilus]MEB8494398.1 hypothetical protein [Acidithiobacillus ferriphilus]MEB8515166.1 hypothetical protein [Acidithiobacillus ferriphilus]MEB8520642.1 hypothetical protein [Acidithiobacillus ferriphilus]